MNRKDTINCLATNNCQHYVARVVVCMEKRRRLNIINYDKYYETLNVLEIFGDSIKNKKNPIFDAASIASSVSGFMGLIASVAEISVLKDFRYLY